ncbi:MAG: hypothetical protein JKY65_21125 [Planctomycetes bacterium]|nr:hypothetical protein [Planctomycetota bacterium]
MKTRLATLSLILLAAGCGSEGKSTQPGPVTPADRQQVFVTAGAEVLTPSTAPIASGVDLARLNVTQVSAVYDLTTPVDEPIAFNVFTRGEGNSGAVRVSVAHALAGGATPTGGAESLALVGVQPNGTALANRAPWVDSTGDGFARLTLSGAIGEEQVIAVQAQTSRGAETILIRVRIGAPSRINVISQNPPPAGYVKSSATLYSSDSWQFGLPTVATTGSRSTVVVYEGDAGDRFSAERYEMRLQYDDATKAVTGGASDESSGDTGNWRDHEIAALFNVLALVHSGDQEVKVRLSFDRGATFAQDLVLERSGFNNRLVQVAIAADYTLAVLFWRTVSDFRSELVLVEGTPAKFDATGSPTEFSFGAPTPIRTTRRDSTPVIMGAQYSSGGDLVIGYAYTELSDVPAPGGRNGVGVQTLYQCAVRLFGETAFTDTTVDDVITWSFDPSVALRGSGTSLEIFYGYEAGDGVRFKRSTDAGKTFGSTLVLGDRSAHMPSVMLREQAGAQRLDIVYLQRADFGNELHVAHWDDYSPSGVPTIYRLTTATRTGTTGRGGETTSVAWLGYDATLQGDDVVVVFHEQTYEFRDAIPIMLGAPTGTLGSAQASAAPFTPATPPPLAPGLTQPLPAPTASDRNQLKWLCLD